MGDWFFRGSIVRSTLLVASSMLTFAAHAQPATPENSQEADAVSNEILVTGSRIARPELDSNSPLVTIGQTAIQTTNAVTLDDTLNRLPQITAAFGSGSNNSATGGVSTVSLRGLDAPRTLVLLDGRS